MERRFSSSISAPQEGSSLAEDCVDLEYSCWGSTRGFLLMAYKQNGGIFFDYFLMKETVRYEN